MSDLAQRALWLILVHCVWCGRWRWFHNRTRCAQWVNAESGRSMAESFTSGLEGRADA